MSGQFHPYARQCIVETPQLGGTNDRRGDHRLRQVARRALPELEGYRAPLQTRPILIEWPSLPLNGLSASPVIDEYGLHAEIPELRGYQRRRRMFDVQFTPSLGAAAGLGYNFKSASTAARALF